VVPPKDLTCCVFCGLVGETETHMFVHCRVVWKIWEELLRWLQGAFIMPPNLFTHWACWDGLASSKKVKMGLRLIWHTSMWVIWKARNNCIFNNVLIKSEELVEEVKVLSWRWSFSRLNIQTCQFYEWVWDPKECCSR